MKLAILSVTPSPYQRDFFAALYPLLDPGSRVFYLEGVTPDSPWPQNDPHSFESVLEGKTIGTGRVRAHRNTLPADLAEFDALLLNIPITSFTLRQCLRVWPKSKPWYFWGEIFREPKSILHRAARNFLLRPLRQARMLFAVGEHARKDYRARFPHSRVECLPYSSRLESFRQAGSADRPAKEPTELVFCGQMIPRKGIDTLLEAFSAWVTSGGSARLTLIGRTDDVEQRLSRLPLAVSASIRLIGFCPPEQLPARFAEADLFVLPSRHDGWGVVVPQALAAALPVISTTTTGAAVNLIRPGENGLLVEPDNPAALREAIQSIMENAARIPAMRAAAQASVEQETPERHASRLLHFLQQSA